MKQWLKRLAVCAVLFVGVIIAAVIVGEILGIHLGDNGYGPLLLVTIVVYYIVRNKVLNKLGLAKTPKAPANPPSPPATGG